MPSLALLYLKSASCFIPETRHFTYSNQTPISVHCSSCKLYTWSVLNKFAVCHRDEGPLSIFGIYRDDIGCILKHIGVRRYETVKYSLSLAVGATCLGGKLFVVFCWKGIIIIILLRKIRAGEEGLFSVSLGEGARKREQTYAVVKFLAYAASVSHGLQHDRATSCHNISIDKD